MKLRQFLFCFFAILLLIFTGCLERKETITVNRNGETTIVYEIDGNVESFENSNSYPTREKWKILKEERYTDKDNNAKIKLKASQTLKSNEVFPVSFTNNSSNNFSLQFPTQLEIWKEGNKTFYRFERTYQARMFKRFNAPDELDENKELEERVLDKGIFNVSESDRNQYIENLTLSMMYHTYAIYLEAIGDMIIQDKFPLSKKVEAEKMISAYIEEAFADTVVLNILLLDESSIDLAYENLLNKIELKVSNIVSEVTDINQKKTDSPFMISLSKIKKMYTITEALTSDKFSVTLHLPGVIITTNGFTGPEEQGLIYWEFSGEGLHDAHIPLFALSVVED